MLTRIVGAHVFRSTPLREGRRPATSKQLAGRSFDPRPCARGDKAVRPVPPFANGFDPRPCARGDINRSKPPQMDGRFDPRPCARGRRRRSARNRSGRDRFDPRPCAEGRREKPCGRGSRERVSIHAPARGATCAPGVRPVPVSVFRSTPLREGRHARGHDNEAGKMFRSTPLREGRPGSALPCARGDIERVGGVQRVRFRSTPLREGRPASSRSPARSRISFDPRPCARGDEHPAGVDAA